MLFNTKRLLAKKQQMEDKIQNTYNQIDDVYQRLIDSFRMLYPWHEFSEIFDITVIDYWFSDVVCSYDGQNYDLSDTLFKMCDELYNVEVDTLSSQDLIRIYNVLTFLINDVCFKEVPIIVQTDLPIQNILDLFKELAQILASLKADTPSGSIDKLCLAMQNLYSFLDFSLNDNQKQKYLRQLKNQYLLIQESGYDDIDHYKEEIEKINAQLEKQNYSKDGKKVAKKEIAPFPTLKAYNNAMALFVCCMQAAEKYESEGNLLSPSCINDIKHEVFDRIVHAKEEFDEWDGTENIEHVAHTLLAHSTFDMLASGRYHVYKGILNPMNCSSNLMLIYDNSMDYGVSIGMITKQEKEEQRKYLLKRISEVG